MARRVRAAWASPAYLLFLIHQGVRDWVSLCGHFDTDPWIIGTITSSILDNLYTLEIAGFLEIEGDRGSGAIWGAPPKGTFKVSSRWLTVQAALRISLKELAVIDRKSLTPLTPFFGPPSGRPVPDVFVVMPFKPEFETVWHHISEAAGRLGLTSFIAMDLFGADSIMQDVWNAISGSRAVVADCTGKNPNVFYEVGIAHTLGRPVILLSQHPEDVPFDIRHVRHILYDLTIDGLYKLSSELDANLRVELGLESGRRATSR